MVIWLSMIIPVGTLVYLLCCHRKDLIWQEVVILLAVPAVIIGIVKATAEFSQTRDTEYWGGWVVDTRHYEDWNEYIHKTCIRSYPCGTDSNGNTKHCTETYDCSYVDYHPEYWEIRGSNEEKINISRERFELLCQKFGNKSFVELNRRYYTNDGDVYIGKWTKEEDLLEPIASIHTWENRVQASKSVFKFPEVTDKSGLYEYPDIQNSYRQSVVLGAINQPTGVKRMEYWNAVLGAKKKVRMYTLIYRNLPMQKAMDQQSLWMGGNKNELNIAVGLDNADAVQWAHVFSWSDIESLKVEAKNYIVGQSTFNLAAFADWLGPEVQKRWVKKNFHDFDYLSIDPSLWGIILAYVLSLAASLVTAYFVVNN